MFAKMSAIVLAERSDQEKTYFRSNQVFPGKEATGPAEIRWTNPASTGKKRSLSRTVFVRLTKPVVLSNFPAENSLDE